MARSAQEEWNEEGLRSEMEHTCVGAEVVCQITREGAMPLERSAGRALRVLPAPKRFKHGVAVAAGATLACSPNSQPLHLVA
jgi:hypothetical protein